MFPIKTFKLIWNIVTWLIVLAFVFVAFALVGVRVFGIEPLSVKSGSMEPAYYTGSVVYLEKPDPKEIKVDDTITFKYEGMDIYLTHRVVKVDMENQQFYTKGDANDTADGRPVKFTELHGRVVFTIPYLGYVAVYKDHPPVRMAIIAAVCFLLLLLILPSFFTTDEKEKKELEETKKQLEQEKEEAEKTFALNDELEKALADLKEKIATQDAGENGEQTPAPQEEAEPTAQDSDPGEE